MSTQNVRRITVLVLFAIALAGLFSAPAQAQNTNPQAPEEAWYRTAEGVQEKLQDNSLLFFVFIFSLGVVTSLTPCVLPMIPITMSIVSGSKQHLAGQSAARTALAGLRNSLRPRLSPLARRTADAVIPLVEPGSRVLR